ncbi:hypothetical protein C8Q80DRAFT_1196599 [Daedaleopsis nitida]|nr:hypothetical protein C8Q80DRAFT_1196599 [Daedaleopsis nitida]
MLPLNRRSSVHGSSGFNLTLPDVYSDSREHGYRGPTRHVRLARATTNGGGSIAKSEDGVRCVVAGRESLRILRMSDTSPTGQSQSDHRSSTGRGGHRIDASRNLWDGSGLKVDSSSTDVAWCHGVFNNKILTSARNGELILWDLNKNGPSKFERRTRDHARSIHVLQYSPILQSYCMTGSADGDLRIWDIRDLTKSIMRIHHPAAVRAVAFSPVSSQSRHVVAALDNGSMYRWDLHMGQRGQLDRIPVAHAGPILSLDWLPPSSMSPTSSSTRQSGSGNWYGTGAGFFEDILPSVPIAGTATASTPDVDTTSPGWIISGGMDRTVKVWDLTHPATRHTSQHPTNTLHTSFPVRRVLWRPGYECELAIVSNADFGIGTGADFGHGALGGNTSGSSGLNSTVPSPRNYTSPLAEGSGSASAAQRAKSVTPHDGSDPVEVWDVRRGYIAKWVVTGSAVEGGVTDIDFADSHALWALHSSGTFSQLDLRQAHQPLDAIPRSAISWNTSGSIAFVTDRPRRWEVPYDDIDPDLAKDKSPAKALGNPPYRPATQNVGAFVPEGAMDDLDTIEKLARGYVFTDREKPQICAHNANVAMTVSAHDAAQTWSMLESLLTELTTPPTPPLSPLPFANPQLPHSASAPAAIPTVGTLPQTPAPPRPPRSVTSDGTSLVRHKDRSPGSRSKHSDDRRRPSTSGRGSPHGITPTSSTASSPRKSSTGLPNVPAAIFARRESGAGLPPPLRPRLPSSFRRPSFSTTQSLYSTHSDSPSDSLRLNLRHVGEGALDDSDSSDSGSDDGGEDGSRRGGDKDSEKDVDAHPTSSASSSRGPNSPYLHRATTAHPSPLSRLAVTGQQTWTEDEKDDDSSPSPASTSEEETDYDDGASGSGAGLARRPLAVRMQRRSSARSRTRSRSSTVASLVAPPPSSLRKIVKQDSQSSIRTVTAGESTPAGTLSRADGVLRRDDTIRDLSGRGAASVRASSSSLRHTRARSEALSGDFVYDGERTDDLDGLQTPMSTTRTQSGKTREAVRDAEARLRALAWDTMRERFEQYADEGDVIMCAMLALVVPEELKISKIRTAQFVEAYIEILSRLRLHTCAAYIRKFVSVEDIRATTSMQTTIYSTCGRCRKPIMQPAGPMIRSGKPSGSYAFCLSCQASITKCSICHLPVRSLMFQCPVCLHGGHQDCYREFYMRRPPDEITPPPLPPSLRLGRTIDMNPPRGRALSRTNSTYTGDGESDDGASAQGDGDGTTGSYNSGRVMLVTTSNMALGRLCAAGCGHYCWAVHDSLVLRN